MPPAPRRRLEPQARRQEIIDAAERLLRTSGAAVRVEDIVREARAARGTFYVYFPSWEDLLEALRRRILDAFDDANPLPTERDGPIDWPALVDRLAVAFVDSTVGMGGLHDVIFHGDFAQRRPPAREDNAVARLTAIIRAAQEAGAVANVDPEPTARLLFAVIHETADAVAAGEDRDRALAAMRRVLRGALTPAS